MAMREENKYFHISGFICPSQLARFCPSSCREKKKKISHLTRAVMTNKPIDRSMKLGASNSNSSAFASDTTNPAPPKKFKSSSSSPKAKNPGEKLSKLSRYRTATLYAPPGQFFFNMILQIAMFASAIAFGVKSISIAKTTNEYSADANILAARALEEARVANQISMLAVCLQSGDVQVCFRFYVFVSATNQ